MGELDHADDPVVNLKNVSILSQISGQMMKLSLARLKFFQLQWVTLHVILLKVM
jgi:hypothetical protein